VQILNTIKRLFRNDEFQVLTAKSGAEALDILKVNDVDLVVSDQRMPNMNGSELLEKVNELYPPTKRVMMSGFADIHAVVEAVNQGQICQFLTKPWNKDELKQAVYDYLAPSDDENKKEVGQKGNVVANTCSLELLVNNQREEILALKGEIQALKSEVSKLKKLDCENR